MAWSERLADETGACHMAIVCTACDVQYVERCDTHARMAA